jgi:hypothetical protein
MARVESPDDLLVFFNEDDFGTTAVFTLAGGGTVTALGIYENPVASRGVTENMQVTVQAPTFVCRSVDVANVTDGDTVVIDGSNHIVRGIITDGTGVTTLMLEVA